MAVDRDRLSPVNTVPYTLAMVTDSLMHDCNMVKLHCIEEYILVGTRL